MQYLTHCFAFQIEEEGNGAKSESKNPVREREKRIREVGTTYVPQCSLQLLETRIRVSYSASRRFESLLLIFSCFSYFTRSKA
jgi:hypothetical protein